MAKIIPFPAGGRDGKFQNYREVDYNMALLMLNLSERDPVVHAEMEKAVRISDGKTVLVTPWLDEELLELASNE